MGSAVPLRMSGFAARCQTSETPSSWSPVLGGPAQVRDGQRDPGRGRHQVPATRGEVVQDPDLVAAVEERTDEVTPDRARPTGDENGSRGVGGRHNGSSDSEKHI